MEKKEILDTSVAIVKKEGIVTIFSLLEYPPCNKKQFEVLFPNAVDYAVAVDIADSLRERGRLLGAIDILISAMCINRNAKLISLDKDFEVIKEAYPELDLKLLA